MRTAPLMPPMNRLFALALSACAVLLLAAQPDDPKKDLEVHEWALWIADPNAENVNARDRYASALPSLVTTIRSYQTKPDEPRLGPLSVLTIYGEPLKDVEVSLQAQAGQFLAHWPTGDVKNRRLRWMPLELTAAPNEKGTLLSVPEDHWFQQARKGDTVWVNHGARTERFLAYDAEVKFPMPFKIEGGTDRYRIANTTSTPLHDVAVILPTPEGVRIGWLDVLPPAPPAAPQPQKSAAAQPTLRDSLDENPGELWSVAFSADGKTLAAGGGGFSEAGTVTLWDLSNRQLRASLKGHSGGVSSVAFSPDGKTLATASWDKTIKFWNAETGQERLVLKGHSSAARLAFSLDSGTLVSAGEDKTIKLWDVNTGKELATLNGHKGPPFCIALSPDGKTLATGGDTPGEGAVPELKLWDVAARKEIASLEGHTRRVVGVAFSPDGKTLASASDQECVKLWDVATRKEVTTFQGQKAPVYAVAFSPDGKTLATTPVDDQCVKLWEVATGRELASLKGHKSIVRAVAFSPDGKTLATASVDKTVKLWNVAAELAKAAPAVTGTPVEVVMSQPLTPDSPELQSLTTAVIRERLLNAGLKEQEIDLIFSLYSKAFFESREMIVLFRLPQAAVDEKLSLEVFPEAQKVVRVVLVLARNIDPRMKDEVKDMIARLGSPKYTEREAAEKRLVELGAVAVPALKEALKNKDLEVVFRAERVLLERNESIDAK